MKVQVTEMLSYTHQELNVRVLLKKKIRLAITSLRKTIQTFYPEIILTYAPRWPLSILVSLRMTNRTSGDLLECMYVTKLIRIFLLINLIAWHKWREIRILQAFLPVVMEIKQSNLQSILLFCSKPYPGLDTETLTQNLETNKNIYYLFFDWSLTVRYLFEGLLAKPINEHTRTRQSQQAAFFTHICVCQQLHFTSEDCDLSLDKFSS